MTCTKSTHVKSSLSALGIIYTEPDGVGCRRTQTAWASPQSTSLNLKIVSQNLISAFKIKHIFFCEVKIPNWTETFKRTVIYVPNNSLYVLHNNFACFTQVVVFNTILCILHTCVFYETLFMLDTQLYMLYTILCILHTMFWIFYTIFCTFYTSLLMFYTIHWCWQVLSPTGKETNYSDRRFLFSYILFIIIIGENISTIYI